MLDVRGKVTMVRGVFEFFLLDFRFPGHIGVAAALPEISSRRRDIRTGLPRHIWSSEQQNLFTLLISDTGSVPKTRPTTVCCVFSPRQRGLGSHLLYNADHLKVCL